jgi:hypothetical protein
MFKQPPGSGVEDRVKESVTYLLPPGILPDGQSHPLANHRHMTSLEDRPGCCFQALQVGCHFGWIVTRAATIRAGDQDEHSAIGIIHLLFLLVSRTILH